MPALEVKDLTVKYGLLVAVDGLSLTVDAGEVVVLLGANGAGKSSSLAAICGATKPASGTVLFDGRDVTGRRANQLAREGIVLVPEGRRIIGPMSVEDNLLLGAGLIRPKSKRLALLDDVYDRFPVLKQRRKGFGGLLSGGEQQMLAFGRALMAQPRLLLLDEPSMGLAPIVVEDVMRSIEAMAGAGEMAILMVEQNAEVAMTVADRAVVIEQGRVVLEGTTEALARNPDVENAFLGL